MAFHFTISAVTWKKLSKENRQAIQKAASLTATEMNKVINELEVGYVKTLRDKGMVLIYPDIKAIRKAARPAVDRLLTKLKPGVPEAADKAISGGK